MLSKVTSAVRKAPRVKPATVPDNPRTPETVELTRKLKSYFDNLDGLAAVRRCLFSENNFNGQRNSIVPLFMRSSNPICFGFRWKQPMPSSANLL